MIVTFICTDRGTHERVDIYIVQVPLPEGWAAYPGHSEMDLACDRCGRAPRLSNSRLRALIESVAETPSKTFDISLADL